MSKNSSFWQHGETDAGQRLKQLDALCGISRALSATAERQDALCRVLDILDKELGLNRGAITLLSPDGKESRIEAVHDISEQKSRDITYRIGEGVTGKVTETGRAAVVPRVSQEPLFLNRFDRWNVTKQELSFVCVPIVVADEVIGTISADRPFDENATLDEEVRILSIVAGMIANDMRARREAAIERQELSDKNRKLRRELGERFGPEGIIGKSRAMRDVLSRIEGVGPTEAILLIRGETGTGKDFLAQAIHYSGPRRQEPFAAVNCAALNDSLLQSELFGHEKDAFAGASESRKGRLEEAGGGTLLLEEIGSLSPALQIRLVRVLGERQFERVGGNLTIKTNARIIAATNLDLEKAVGEGGFRKDLYCLISPSTIVLPPLRRRKNDVLLLADHFVGQYSKKMGKDVRRISTLAIDMMMAYHWPGNVQELENCIERAVLLSTDGVVHGHHLPPTLQTPDASNTRNGSTFKDMVHLFERDLIVDALKRSNGNLAAAARELQATPRIIRHRVKELGIDYRRYSSKRG
ncbi:MAG: sigma 54-interacting transcriptional regulator [Planctomycetota bacterium]|jgi:Nif-specific regulatory protein